jgi:tetratricopeptide (TPR) repeat protein
MPATLNGFGTTYSKHLNEHGYATACASCGREERLTSFDTHEAVAVLFVPVVKLKALRIIASCPNCTMHRAMPREAWRKALDELVARSQAALAAESSTVDNAIVMLAELIELGDVPAFDTLMPLLETKLADDAIGLRALGHAARMFDKPDLAVKLLEQSLAVRESNETHAELALVWALRVEPQKALRSLEHLLRLPDQLELSLLVVDAFQMRGLHAEALQLVERIERALPQFVNEKLVKEARAVSAREVKKGKPTPSWRPRLSRMRFPSATLDMGKRRTTKKDLAIAAACVAVCIGGYLGYGEMLAQKRPLIVVNGSARTYDVDVDGRKVKVRPYEHRAIEGVGEGTHRMTVSGEGLQTQSADFTMESPPLPLHAFYHPRFILNPDRSAAFLYESTEYTSRSEPDPDENWWDVVTGRLLTSIDADFAFVPFPAELDLGSSSSATRTRVSLAKGELHGALELVDKTQNPALAIGLLKARLAFDPADVEAQRLLAARQ